ncbi:MAG: hypothetical protein Q8O03_03215 [Nanoarchaeota archaeon]|nr:hypothetical protein [Nanoarchaeota archaeon]
MMDESRKTICDQCRKPVPISDIRYVQRGKDSVAALCSDCRSGRGSATKSVPMKTGNVSASKTVTSTKTVPKQEGNKKVYFCTLCRYKFKLDPSGKSKIVCPFCGRTNGVEEFAVQSAEELIEKIRLE